MLRSLLYLCVLLSPILGEASGLLENNEHPMPNDTRPVYTHVTLNVLDNTVSGHVSIKIHCAKSTDNILLHVDNIDVQSVAVHKDANTVDINWNIGTPERHFLNIKLKEMLNQNENYTVDVKYTIKYSNAVKGLRWSPDRTLYQEESGFLTTNFEPIYARRTFPCYDMPTFKSIFQLTVDTEMNYEVISNLRRQSINMAENRKTTTFSSDKEICARQLELVIYDRTKTETNSSLFKEEIKNMKFYEIGSRKMIVTETDVYWTAPLSSKLPSPNVLAPFNLNPNSRTTDVIGQDPQNIDSYFTWEFLTRNSMAFEEFQDSDNYVDVSSTDKFMSFSKGLETFSKYFVTTEKYDNKDKLMEIFAVSNQIKVMYKDVSPSPITIEDDTDLTEKILQKFDRAAVMKGAAFFRTLFILCGQVEFVTRINTFLFSKNAQTNKIDLFYRAFENTPKLVKILPQGVKFSDLFGSWLKQEGYPIIRANRSGEKITLSFKNHENAYSWSTSWIPVTYYTEDIRDTNEVVLWWTPEIDEGSGIDFTVQSHAKWFVLNKEYLAYYRVMYDDNSWKALIESLSSMNRNMIKPLNRAQLIDDAFALAKAEFLDYKTAFDLLKTFRNETDIVPWIAAQESLKSLDKFLIDHPIYKKYQDFKRYLLEDFVTNTINKHGVDVKDGDSQLIRSTRIFALRAGCQAKIPKCIEAMKEKFDSALKNKEYHINPDLQFVVYCTGMENANQSIVKQLYVKYTTASSLATKQVIAESFGCAKEADVIDRLFELTGNLSNIMSSIERTNILKRMMETNKVALSTVFNFLDSNKKKLKDLFENDDIKELITALSLRVIESHQNKKFNDFVEYCKQENIISETLDKYLIKNTKKTMEDNKKWLESNLGHIKERIENLKIS